MGYYLDAWLEKGKPHLRIVDAKTGKLCLTWDYQEDENNKAVQALFKELFLLVTTQNLSKNHIKEEKLHE